MDWRDRAACRGADTDIFFPINTSGRHSAASMAGAKAICAGCVVGRDCLRWALAMDVVGIWGGTDETERRTLHRRRRGHDNNNRVGPHPVPAGAHRR